MNDNKQELSDNTEVSKGTSSYGSYKSISFHYVKILNMVRSMGGYKNLKPTTILAFESTIHKILRMTNSGKEDADLLADIINYTTLALNEIKDNDTEKQ